MRGSPLIRLILVSICLALVAIPVCRLTRHEVAAQRPVPATSTAESGRWLDVEMTASEPGRLTLSSLGHSLMDSGKDEVSLLGRIYVSGQSPDDLVAGAKWENTTTNHALRVVVTDNGQPIKDVTFWGKESVEDVLP